MSSKQPQCEQPMAAWVGLDWSDDTHHICLQEEGQSQIEQAQVGADPESVHQWLAQLRERFQGRRVGVCLEQSRIGLMYALISCEVVVLYPVNPQSMAKYRKVFKVSGAKDDGPDAELMLDLLLHHRDRLQVLQPGDSLTRQIQLLCEGRRKLMEQRTRLLQQLQSTLKTSFPQALKWAGTLSRPYAWCFLKRWPLLQRLQAARAGTLDKWYASQSRRRPRRWKTHLDEIRQAQPLTDDEAVLCSGRMMTLALVQQIEHLSQAIEQFDEKIQQCWQQHQHRQVFESFPGAGKVLAPRLAAAFGCRSFSSAQQVQQLSGIAPITRKSGQSRQVLRRYACPRFLLQTFHEFAACSIPHSRWARQYYLQQRERGSGHHAAVRALAYKWIRVLFRCWQTQTPYDEHLYWLALQRRGSALAARLGSPAAA